MRRSGRAFQVFPFVVKYPHADRYLPVADCLSHQRIQVILGSVDLDQQHRRSQMSFYCGYELAVPGDDRSDSVMGATMPPTDRPDAQACGNVYHNRLMPPAIPCDPVRGEMVVILREQLHTCRQLLEPNQHLLAAWLLIDPCDCCIADGIHNPKNLKKSPAVNSARLLPLDRRQPRSSRKPQKDPLPRSSRRPPSWRGFIAGIGSGEIEIKTRKSNRK
jgi:hypothetical protein